MYGIVKGVNMPSARFEWNAAKESENVRKHGVTFALAQQAFLDPRRVLARDLRHSLSEDRYFCMGRVEEGVLTVRFTFRNGVIRIIGAGFWRKGKETYEEENSLHG
jgi:uncharacterized DUF497 family protein